MRGGSPAVEAVCVNRLLTSNPPQAFASHWATQVLHTAHTAYVLQCEYKPAAVQCQIQLDFYAGYGNKRTWSEKQR